MTIHMHQRVLSSQRAVPFAQQQQQQPQPQPQPLPQQTPPQLHANGHPQPQQRQQVAVPLTQQPRAQPQTAQQHQEQQPQARPAQTAQQGNSTGSGSSQRERLLAQMCKFVLVHHQLSCMLIEGAAQEAGLEAADVGLLEADADGSLDASVAFQREAGGEADGLHDRVDNIIGRIEGELEAARGRTGSCPPTGSLRFEASGEEECAAASGVSAEELEEECAALERQVEAQRAEAAQLREELQEVEEATQRFQASLTSACFDEVQRAEARVEALESVVCQLDSGPVDAAKVSAIVAQLDAAAARAAAIAARPGLPGTAPGGSLALAARGGRQAGTVDSPHSSQHKVGMQ